MTAPLYTTEILRLAASLGSQPALHRVDATAEERAPTCGSRVLTRVELDDDGHIVAITQQVEACAFGQASAALLARDVAGKGIVQVETAIGELGSWLSGETNDPGAWPGFGTLAPARTRRGRHPAILLPFRSLLAALKSAA